MGSQNMRILDLRLAERALKGEGRPKVTGGSSAISRQMKREAYRRDRLTRQIDKEQRQMRERLNLIERNFLSEQMFKKDLNPFQTVIKRKSQMNYPGTRNKSDKHYSRNETNGDVIKGNQFKGSLLPNTGGHWRSLDGQLLERVLNTPKNKPEILPRGNSDILNESKEFLRQNIFLKPLKSQRASTSPSKRVAFKDQLIEIPNLPPILSRESRSAKKDFKDPFRGESSEQYSNYQKCPEIPNLNSHTNSYPMTGSNVLKSALKKSSTSRFPPVISSESTRGFAPPSKPRKSVTFWDCGNKWEASMKSYENILTEVCRALSPGEARLAEEKRIEAEDQEGITQQRQKILNQCRTTAEQDVFKDFRWKELMSTIDFQRDPQSRQNLSFSF